MIKNVLVVGSGTAGLIIATILKRQLGFNIDVISSKKIDIIGVGEGTTPHFGEYLDFVGIDRDDMIKKCGATYKAGVFFDGWNTSENYHVGFFPALQLTKMGQYLPLYAKLLIDGKSTVDQDIIDNKIDPSWLDSEVGTYNQFHFDSRKLNDYLIEFSKGMGIGFIEDVVEDVVLSENGDINLIKGELSDHKYDFYIDATGFKKVLISKMGAKWQSYSKYLKMNSAITFVTEEEDEHSIWTLAKAMDAGWMFNIPVQGRCGNGYIFDDNYINEEQAKKEVEEYLGREIDVSKKFKFDPGAIDRPWINNCVSVGLSSAFVEPLEASSIAMTIAQSFSLMHRMGNYDEDVINHYNKSFNDIAENTRDLIVLHYITNKRDTDFWKDISKLELPETLQQNLNIWKDRFPISEDFSGLSDYILFREPIFIKVLSGLELFNMESIENEFECISDESKQWIKNMIEDIETYQRIRVPFIGHKKFIELVKNK